MENWQNAELDLANEEIEETTIPSKTYRVHNGRIIGMVDGLEAVRQAVEKILRTQLFEWSIYSDLYGVETDRFIGQDFDYVKSDLERTIEEGLLYDDRVEMLENFEFVRQEKDELHVYFDVITVDGSFPVEGEVPL